MPYPYEENLQRSIDATAYAPKETATTFYAKNTVKCNSNSCAWQ
jgi:hypothetical protein